MRKAFRATFLPGSHGPLSTRFTRVAYMRVLLAAVLLIVLTACGTAPSEQTYTQAEPEFDLELELSLIDLPVNEAHRVRFLPPLAWTVPTGQFVNDMELEIRFFNVNPNTGQASGGSLGTPLSTAKRTILNQRGTFATVFLSLTLAFDRKATEFIRAEIRVPGGPNSPVCNPAPGSATEACLGYLDMYVFKGLKLNRSKLPAGFVPTPALLGVVPIGFKVLEEQAPPVGGPAPATINALQGVSGGVLSEADGNCTSSFLTRPGQGLQAVGAGLQAVGAVGGLFTGAAASYPSSPLAPWQIGSEMAQLLRPTFYPDWSATILVVDDFSNGFELPAALFGPNPDLEALAPQISHGALVMHHLRQMAEGMIGGMYWEWDSGIGPNGHPYYLYREMGASYGLYLQAVDVGQYNTDTIPALIRTALQEYGEPASPYGVADVVVNMSFAVVPCAVLHDFNGASSINTFEDYLAALAEVNDIGEQYLEDLDQLVSVPVSISTDPLLTYLDCPLPYLWEGQPYCDGGLFNKLYHVASSGNYGGAYALYPSASPNVVSVGSLEVGASDYVVSGYSNVAEIAAPGGLFELSAAGSQIVSYAGTSFAGPAVSLFIAVDAMDWPARCPQTLAGGPPVLASGIYNMLPFYLQDFGSTELWGIHLCITPG